MRSISGICEEQRRSIGLRHASFNLRGQASSMEKSHAEMKYIKMTCTLKIQTVNVFFMLLDYKHDFTTTQVNNKAYLDPLLKFS